MTSSAVQPDQLPATITSFLRAHAARDTATALRRFAPTSVVVDQDERYEGTAGILRFLQEAGAQFTYTTELIGAQRVDDTHWVATNRITGDFPGGTADLNYRFELDGDLIAELVIGP